MKFSYVTKKKLSRADLSDYLAAAQRLQDLYFI